METDPELARIYQAIPHRPPFLLIDRILHSDETGLVAETTLRPESPLWQAVYPGHYPGEPITPGVLLCEMVFQAAAVFLGERFAAAGAPVKGVPVLTRIGGARFKQMVRPGDTVTIHATLKEQVANAFYMTGQVKVGGTLAVGVEYTVALVAAERTT